MSPGEAFAACEAAVHKSDPDRYFASLFAPADKRPLLFALYAFNHEIARAAEVAREPMMAAVRLQWWREALDEAVEGRPRIHPVAFGLSELLQCTGIAAVALEALIDARCEEIAPAPLSDLAALEAHVDATSTALMRAAVCVLDPNSSADELTGEAGVAYGLAGIIRAIPFHAARNKSFLPVDLLAAERLSTNDALSIRNVAPLKKVISKLATAAMAHFMRAKQIGIPKRVLPAILPASLVPAHLSHATRRNRNPLRDHGEISLFRRQLILLRAASLRTL